MVKRIKEYDMSSRNILVSPSIADLLSGILFGTDEHIDPDIDTVMTIDKGLKDSLSEPIPVDEAIKMSMTVHLAESDDGMNLIINLDKVDVDANEKGIELLEAILEDLDAVEDDPDFEEEFPETAMALTQLNFFNLFERDKDKEDNVIDFPKKKK